ncbi:helix-hairpin-helix domain-containing protein [Streptomyces sp. Je 1-79]|uniref:helix-hairpin-helix domain-containing protein n=1 Tax=Streptomyces sp. Je 1-79 TaxID=2943847 RepID=UPI0021A5AA0E|nr:helix-hairpin-helix domain-containing protein [Streptomyces sp. Je 1-79]MCT4353812.1 helix-hairpin-helix domain-containing protein [Streptomyces sp. Je 1-79]
MTTLAHLRAYALALPEVEEGTSGGRVAFSVRGKGFVSAAKDGHVTLRLSQDETEAALTAHATGEHLARAGRPIGFRVPLADIDGKDLNALVRAAWFGRAPKRLAASPAAAEAAADEPGGDLPPGIGRPATRALLGAGLETLDQVARRTRRELLAMHGVGPKAVRIISETLEQQGKSLRG